jgi:hypothetical protein
MHERLTALTLMYIHPQIDINIDEVIDRFLDKPIKRKLLQWTDGHNRHNAYV